jgi:AraC-like DNA-binding protein
MRLRCAYPPAALHDCIRYFQQRAAEIVDRPIIYPIAARPDVILEFYLQERYRVRAPDSDAHQLVPAAVIVGPFTSRHTELVLRGNFDVFTIHFQASGFHRLFRQVMSDLADRAYDAESIIGPEVYEIAQKLAETSSFQERARIATKFLLRRLEDRTPPDAVSAVANWLLLNRGLLRVDKAAASTAFSVRHFERRFAEQVGLPPKRYARIVRFNAALTAKIAAPQRLWTDIAHDLGFYDQMHLVRDFECFAGESPNTFLRRFWSMPEVWM